MSAPIPSCLEAIDAAWLSEVFDAPITDVSPLEPAGGIAVTSRVARLALECAQPGAAPASVFVKSVNPRWTHGFDLAEREVHFYRDFAASELPVPRCYYAEIDREAETFALVLEDFGDIEPGHRLDGLDSDEADAVIDGIADLHRAFWNRSELNGLPVRSHASERIAATLAKLERRWPELDAGGKYAIDDALRVVLDTARVNYAAGMRAISSAPQTLVHSDLHVENFFLEATPEGLRLRIVDWQNASFGHCAFDLSHVLASLRPELASSQQRRLLARYADRVQIAGLELERDVAAAMRHQFIGSAIWFATFEAETLRDSRTLQGHWRRLSAAFVALETRVSDNPTPP